MADTKVSAFTQTASVGATDEVPVLQSGNKRSPMSQIRDYIVSTLGALASKSSVATGDIDSNAVTYAKLQDVSATARILGRKTAAAGDTEECTLSEILDFIGSAAQGDLLYRGATSWARLAAGTSGQFLKTLGAGANPAWDTPAGGGSPGGADTQIQFNDAGAFGGDAGFTYNKTTDSLYAAGSITTDGNVTAGSASSFYIGTRGQLRATTDGVVVLTNNANNDFGRFCFGGTTSSFPALKRSSAQFQARLANDSGFTKIQGQLQTHANATAETVTPTHTIVLYDATGTAYRVPCIV